jgi:isopentenyl-diphosphate delta-isomerase type 1
MLNNLNKKLDEMVNVLDENGNIIGQATREECHQDPSKIHAIVDIWLFNEKGEVLIQKQSKDKKPPNGRFNKSCGGHVLAGERIQDACYRELEEELGITNYELRDDLIFIEKFLNYGENKTHLVYLYYGIIGSETKFNLQEEEVESVHWFTIKELRKFICKTKISVARDIEEELEKVLKMVTFDSGQQNEDILWNRSQ